MSREYEVGSEHRHQVFDNSMSPAVRIESGDTVTFDCPGMPLPANATVDDFPGMGDPTLPHTIVGPVAIVDARPGDTLVVDILDIELSSDIGHCIFIPGLGLLPDEFSEPYVQNFTLDGSDHAELKPGVKIPLQPFLGIMGGPPAEPGVHSTIPPRSVGGNLDIRHLTTGSTLMLPVEVEGVLFSCGDGHGAQGDGEVCLTALETALRARLRFTVEKGKQISDPQFIARKPLGRPSDEKGYFGTAAPGPDLYESSQRAIRNLLDYLESERGLTRQEAYVLCSLVADLKINEIVDQPHWLVSAYLPLSVFAD